MSHNNVGKTDFTHIFQTFNLLEICIFSKYYFIYPQIVTLHPTIYIVVYNINNKYGPYIT